MRGLTLVVAACLVLAACGEETPPPPAAGLPALAPVAEATGDEEPPPVDCTQINGVFAASNEPVPFASLRTGPAIAPASAVCTMGESKGEGDGAPTVHAVNCTLFTSGGLDRDAGAAPAKEAFVEARRQMDACLPAGWTMRDGAVAATNANEAVIYESETDAQRAMTASSYTYPVQLKKVWIDDGATSGWRVTLDFQMEAQP